MSSWFREVLEAKKVPSSGNKILPHSFNRANPGVIRATLSILDMLKGNSCCSCCELLSGHSIEILPFFSLVSGCSLKIVKTNFDNSDGEHIATPKLCWRKILLLQCGSK
uniref:Uncharacterized protein n=1 Tax=Glossina pallidipes TaxID=7398 RepID=A0A1B0AFM3_GLOPL